MVLRPPSQASAFLFRGPLVVGGVLFIAIGYLAELLVGPEYAFEYFMLFGGLFLGVGYERNRQESLRRRDA